MGQLLHKCARTTEARPRSITSSRAHAEIKRNVPLVFAHGAGDDAPNGDARFRVDGNGRIFRVGGHKVGAPLLDDEEFYRQCTIHRRDDDFAMLGCCATIHHE